MADLINELSKKERELYELIQFCEERVTNKVIVENLSEKHLGALGKLVCKGLVESTKTTKERDTSGKLIKYYRLKKEVKK